MSLKQSLKVALIQFAAGADKAANIAKVTTKVAEAAKNGAKLVVLPECFNSPYAVSAFPKYAEKIPDGETTSALSDLAKKHNLFLVGGSYPESDAGKVYNTSVAFSPSGDIISKHRKLHLFDIDVPGKITFKESETLTGGDKITLFDMEGYGKIGLGICYDIRFPEVAATAARKGAFAMIYPGAFNTTTGPLHWHLLARARAVDNQLYVIACSPPRTSTRATTPLATRLCPILWARLLPRPTSTRPWFTLSLSLKSWRQLDRTSLLVLSDGSMPTMM